MLIVAFVFLGCTIIVELCWLHVLDRRAIRLADRYVELHADEADSTELVKANRIALFGGAACLLALVILAARLPASHGWFSVADLFIVVVLIPTSTFLFRVALRLKEVGNRRGLR